MKQEKMNLTDIFENNAGILSLSELLAHGFTRLQITQLLNESKIQKIAHGRYTLADEYLDEYILLQTRSSKVIISHASALYLHGLSDRVPHTIEATVPQGYNVSRIKKDLPNVQFFYCKNDLWNMGLTTIQTPSGYEVQTYDLERCICDLVKNRKKVDTQIYTQALREFFSSNYDTRKLIKYARKMNIEDTIRMYVEVMS